MRIVFSFLCLLAFCQLQTEAAVVSGGNGVSNPATTPLNMGSNKITNVTSGTASGDAANFGQISFYGVLCSSTVTLSSSTTSTTWVPSNLGCTATLSNSNHHAVVVATGLIRNSTATDSTYAAVFRDSTNLDDATAGQCRVLITGVGPNVVPCTLLEYDSPADTNAHAYRVRFQADAGTAIFGNASTANMIVFETN